MASEYIYVKLIKSWGGFKKDDIVRFGRSKGEGRIAKGEGIEVEPQNAVNAPMGKPKTVETATIEPKVETAEVTPINPPKKRGRKLKKNEN